MTTGVNNPIGGQTPTNTFNLTAAIADPGSLDKITFSRPESIDERRSRLRRETVIAFAQITKDLIIFLFALAGIAVIIYICIGVIMTTNPNPDDKKWATSILTAVVGGLVGYFTGKASK